LTQLACLLYRTDYKQTKNFQMLKATRLSDQQLENKTVLFFSDIIHVIEF